MRVRASTNRYGRGATCSSLATPDRMDPRAKLARRSEHLPGTGEPWRGGPDGLAVAASASARRLVRRGEPRPGGKPLFRSACTATIRSLWLIRRAGLRSG